MRPRAPASQTRHEQEAARLIAQNLTDQQIVGELGMSAQRVAVRVHRIFRKLGVASGGGTSV